MTGILASSLARQCRDKVFSGSAAFDTIVTTDPAHIGYLGGYRSVQHDVGHFLQALIATRDEVRLVTAASDAPAALEALEAPDAIHRYGTFFVESDEVSDFRDLPPAVESFDLALAHALASLAAVPERIGMDAQGTQVAGLVQGQFPQAAACDIRPALLSARMVKLPGELERLRHASSITSEAIQLARSFIADGVSEHEIAAELSRHMVANGGVPRFVVVTSGERSARVDAYAASRRILPGEIVRLDIGCSVQGYHSDMARTCISGEADAEQRRIYGALLLGEQAQLAALRPGVPGARLFETAVEVVRANGLPSYRRNHCGHGIGLAAHEFPLIAPTSDAVLEPGMVLCLETPYYRIGWGGMMVEDTAIVTHAGCEVITTASRELMV